MALALLVPTFMLVCRAGVAPARDALRAVVYRGYAVRVPRAWPVYDLSRDPQTCVRFDRHALYLGVPSTQQRCPAHLVGRTEAILISPIAAGAARTGGRSSSLDQGLSLEGTGTSFVVRAKAVAVTATWSRARGLVAGALGLRSLPTARRTGRGVVMPARGTSGPRAHAASAASTVYTGPGFDPCSAPSPGEMYAWESSPYRAIGIYVGGTNSACAQPNLTAAWVGSEITAGWHLIPTYVGLQAPANSCGCAAIKPSQASAEGAAAASDAIHHVQALGLPAGNPIYYDMEAYERGGSNTAAVLAFLAAWTTRLHAAGYASGVYSSAGSGISDLASRYGHGFVEPDDIWIAEWNGRQSTANAYVPAGDWSNHQRMHQYRGDHNETYGGVTINIDNDYLDAATADILAAAGSAQVPAPPTLAVSPGADGTTYLYVRWPGAGGASSWTVLAGATPEALSPVAGAPAHGSKARIALHSAAPFFAVQALGPSGQVLASSAAVATPRRIAIFGPRAFVSMRSGLGALPAGCYTGHPCRLITTISAGQNVVARTGPEPIAPNATGLLRVRLGAEARAMIARARSRGLAVQVTTRDASGTTASVALRLVSFSTSGRAPARSVSQSPNLRIVGLSDYVSSSGVGGILAGCPNPGACRVGAALSVGPTLIARTTSQPLGAEELGYLAFSLTQQGRALLAHAGGNHLGAHLTITDAATSATATATIALVRFG